MNAPTPSPKELPEGVAFYRRTDAFTEASIPPGLLKDHCTKAGVWGLIRVAEGRLSYRVTDARRAAGESILTQESAPGVVEPTILHHVEPLGPVRFHVEFYRSVPDPVPLCRHEELAQRENAQRAALATPPPPAPAP